MDTSTATPDPATRTAEPGPRLPAAVRAVLTMLLLLPCAMAVMLPTLIPGVAAVMGQPTVLGLSALTLAYGASLLAYLLVSIALVRGVDRRPVAALGLRIDGRALGALLLGMLIALLVALLTGGVARLAGWEDPALAGGTPTGEVPLLLAIGFLLVRAFVLQGIGEEVLFRGYLLQSLRSRPVLAVLIAAVAFAIPHLASSGGQENVLERVLYLAVPFGFALSAGMLAIATRSVWAAVGIHGGLHVAGAVTAVLGLTIEGPALWVVAGALHTVAALVIGARISRERWREVALRGPYAR